MNGPCEKTARHNAALRLILPILIEHAPAESDQWTILESLCLGIGLMHGRGLREIALFAETMAERFATGERA